MIAKESWRDHFSDTERPTMCEPTAGPMRCRLQKLPPLVACAETKSSSDSTPTWQIELSSTPMEGKISDRTLMGTMLDSGTPCTFRVRMWLGWAQILLFNLMASFKSSTLGSKRRSSTRKEAKVAV